jgi:hypothetical protein
MLVDPDERAIDQDIFKIGVVAESFENVLPSPLLRPAPEARMYGEPIAEVFWQITPWGAGACDPKNSFDEEPIVTPAATAITGLARQLRRDPFPLRIAQHQSNQG